MTTAVAPVTVAVMPIAILTTFHTVVVVILAAFATVVILSAHRQTDDAEDHQQTEPYRSF
jgi:hypothetical protein